jgi:hypothetical protein
MSESFIDYAVGSHHVPQEGPAPSFCRYICRRRCTTPLLETASLSSTHTLPPNGRAVLEMDMNAMSTRNTTNTAAIPLANSIVQPRSLINLLINTRFK